MSKINHPSHYTFGRFEVIDIIEDWGLNFHLGNAVKYIARADRKGTPLEDLQKAVWYLTREIENREIDAAEREKTAEAAKAVTEAANAVTAKTRRSRR